MSTGLGVNFYGGGLPFAGGFADENIITMPPNGDGRTTSNNGNVTLNSAVITCASAAFVSTGPTSDVGKAVNDSLGFVPPGTRIVSVQSGTQATLNAVATGTSAVNVFTIGTGVSSCRVFAADRAYQITDITLSCIHTAAIESRIALTLNGVATQPNDGRKVLTVSLEPGQIFTWSGRIPLLINYGLIAMSKTALGDAMIYGAITGECLD